MDTIEIFDILLLAAIAGFILFRLWSVLGTRTGSERSPETQNADAPARRTGGPSAPLPANDKGPAPIARPTLSLPAPVQRGVAEISAADRSFDAEGFMRGALAAHERVVECFAAGDRAELKQLLGPEVYAAFDGAITARQTGGLTATSVFVKQETPQLVSAALKGRSAEIGVRYESEIIQFSKNAAGDVVEGSESAVKRVIDRWTWVRDVKSGDPNWKLADTDYED
ncbi:hypothetical protein sos41_01830 [Alphaproteobacteria bacterium SO-S41]|nr:hypothetical protein sos41_01830 [Alphaproteobacteria bacterium SO-S41]